MFLKRRLAAFAPIIAALTLAVPLASASAAIHHARAPATGSPSCPADYSGPTNLATGCPWWMMSGATAPASSSPAPVYVADAAKGSPSCPANYSGPTNLATGCPWWMMR